MSCPHCRESARFVAYRGRTALSLLGPVRVERAYYHCKACRRGFHPHDAVLGLDAADATPGRLRDQHREAVTYFENQAHRMDYPTYVEKGWAIGSGPVGAACKTVIGRRLKGTGMRWRPEGADAMAHLRALLVGERGQWAAYWDRVTRAA